MEKPGESRAFSFGLLPAIGRNPHARRPGGGRNPPVTVIPAEAGIHVTVIPAEAGIHLLLLCSDRFGFLLKHIRVFFRPPSWRTGHFSLLAQREVTKRKGTPAVAVAGLLPGDCVRTLRGSLTARPCAGSELGAIPRADPSGFSFAPSPRPRGTPRSKEADLLSAEAGASLRSLRKTRHSGEGRNPAPRLWLRLLISGPCGTAKGGRKRPARRAGEREGSRSFRSRTWMSCQRNPGRP